MGRPKKCRNINFKACCRHFIPDSDNTEINVLLTIDELEAIRLADFEELYQDNAAKEMGISRQTFGLIIQSAHKKIADAIVNGKVIKLERVFDCNCEICGKNNNCNCSNKKTSEENDVKR
ncbi:MAG: DUF134 domain-containing protein [Candidatus Delongbacteria bacterium]|nr:DUF134 domain-containing protein [Candidatus Delongbacteria bacterium]MBN2833552.1 DUF134 domain-containing protein [Candidatus Delongbacteria bacterium]